MLITKLLIHWRSLSQTDHESTEGSCGPDTNYCIRQCHINWLFGSCLDLNYDKLYFTVFVKLPDRHIRICAWSLPVSCMSPAEHGLHSLSGVPPPGWLHSACISCFCPPIISSAASSHSDHPVSFCMSPLRPLIWSPYPSNSCKRNQRNDTVYEAAIQTVKCTTQRREILSDTFCCNLFVLKSLSTSL